MFGMGMSEMMVIGVIAVLLFGKKLPEVARNLGKTYNEFRRGLGDVQREFSSATDTYNSASYRSTASSSYEDYDDRDEATAPKFEPPPAAPSEE